MVRRRRPRDDRHMRHTDDPTEHHSDHVGRPEPGCADGAAAPPPDAHPPRRWRVLALAASMGDEDGRRRVVLVDG